MSGMSPSYISGAISQTGSTKGPFWSSKPFYCDCTSMSDLRNKVQETTFEPYLTTHAGPMNVPNKYFFMLILNFEYTRKKNL